MATIKLVKGDDNVQRWLNEHGDRVVVALYTEFGYVKLDQSHEFEIQLIDPNREKTGRFDPYPHYVIKTDGHNIFEVLKAIPNTQSHLLAEQWTYESVNEIELLEGQYQYFGVVLAPVGNWTEQVTMKDYYENEFFKTKSAV